MNTLLEDSRLAKKPNFKSFRPWIFGLFCLVGIGPALHAQLFYDNFTRATDPGPLFPWVQEQLLDTWTVTGGVLQGGPNALDSYSFVYLTNSWTNYSVEARLQFPAGAYGGGLGGYLDPATGAHYAAWIYPDGSPGGSNLLQLIKFQTWTSFGYTNASGIPMGHVSLPSVGTNWHALKLVIQGAQLAVYYDGTQMISVTDVETQPYLHGGVSVDMWTDLSGYVMSVDDVVVKALTSVPVANDDAYSVRVSKTLVVAAPGVLANDTNASGRSLQAALMSGPANGTVLLNTNGGFAYTPATNFVGTDTFTYQATDGLTNSGAATVAISVLSGGTLFFDNFVRSTYPGPLTPWVGQTGNWAVGEALMQGGADHTNSYGFAYITNSWNDYAVQARVQFPAGAYGGGLGGRLDPVSGAHYAAWVYPAGSVGGSNVLKLIKFQSWTSFGYTNSSSVPMQQVNLPTVGTNWHLVKLAFLGRQIAVYYDGSLVMSVTDQEAQPYLSGSLALGMWTDAAAYVMSVQDVLADPLVAPDSYSVNQDTALNVSAPGVLANDSGVFGTNLAAVLVTGATNGIVNLNTNGGFTYSPATNYYGIDSFTYQVNDGQTNLGTATVLITVNFVCKPPVVATSPVSSTNCPGTPATFSVGASGTALSYQWYKDLGVLANQTNSSLTLGSVSATDAGAYNVVVSGMCGAVTNSASLAVNTVVSASPLVSLTNCPGTMASFSTVAGGTGPWSFAWLKDGVALADQTNSSLSVGPVNGADAGTYSVVVSGACGVVTNSASLAINTVVSASPLVSLTNCPGTMANFSTVAGGTGPLSFAWLKDGVALADQTNSSLSIGPVNGADAGVYSVVVSGACGVVTNSASLAINTVVSASPLVSLTNCPGTLANFSTVAGGTGPLSFAWLKDGVALADQTNSSLSIGPVNGADAGTYSVVVSGACGVVTNSASLAVNTVVSASALVSLTNCPGTMANFSTVAAGTGPLSFVWLKDGVVLAEQTNSSLSVGPVNGADAGVYSVVVSGACGVVTNSASLAINTVVSASPLVSLTNCPGTMASFSTVAGGTGPLNFAWLKDGVALADQTNSSLSIGPVNGADAGTYSVVVSGACGVVTNSAELAINTVVSASPLVSLTNCPGTMASFSTVAGGTGPLNFAWLKDGVALADQTNSSLSIGPVNGADAGVYSVVVSGACGVVTNSASLAVNTVVSANPLVSLTNCPGTMANFSTVTGGTGPLSFAWLKDGVALADQTNSSLSIGPVNGADAGTYSVVVSGACGVVTNSASLAVNTVVSASPLVSLTNCPGTMANFSTAAGGTGPLSFAWLKDGVVLADQTNSSLSVGPVNGADAGVYSVVVSGACGVVTNSADLAINTVVSASPLVSLTNCPGTMANFSTVAGGTGPLSFTWLKDGVVLADQINSSLSIGPVNGADAGTYSVVVSGACGVVTNSAELAINTVVSASPLVSLTNCPGTMANFSTVAGGTGPLSFAWLKDGVVLADQTNSSLSIGPVNGADAGVYSVVVSGACGVVTNSADLAINTVVSASPLVSLTNCPGTLASFSTVAGGTGPLGFVWLKDGVVLADQTNSSLSVGPVNGADAGTYSVVVSGACGVVTNSASLAVNTIVSASPLVSLTNCPGTIASFSTVAGGTGPLGFVWLKDGVVLADQTNSSLSIGPVNGADAGTYSVVVSGACGVVTNSASLAVNTVVSASPLVSLTNCPGTMASFSTVAGGTGPLGFVWLKDGVVLADQTNSSLSVGPVNGADAGVYSVVVSGACGVVTNSADLAINTVVSASPLVSLTNCPGTMANFSTVTGGTGPLSFAWLKDGVALADQTNSSLSIGPVNGADAGTYSVVVSGACGVVTNSASLAVNTGVSASALVSLTNCPGTIANFSTVAGGTGPLGFVWLKDGVVLADQTNSSLSVGPVNGADAGVYSVVVSGACGVVTNSASLAVNMAVSASPLVSLTNCPGTIASFSTVAGGTGPLSFAWLKDGVVLAYQTNSSLSVGPVNGADAGTYSVVVSGACGVVTNSASLAVNTVVSASPLVSLTNCPGTIASFSTVAGGTGPLSFVWLKDGVVLADQTNSSLSVGPVNGADAGTYSVVVSGACGVVTNSASLAVNTGVSASALVSLTNCPGTIANFSTVAGGTGPLGFVWLKDGVVLADQTNSSLSVGPVNGADAGVYSVVVSGACGVVTNSASLAVNMVVSASPLVSLTNCPGTIASFSTVAGGTGPLSFAWLKDGVVLAYQTNSSLSVGPVNGADAGTYSVVVSGACGVVTNSASLAVNTVVSASPLVSLTNCPGTIASFSTVAGGTGPLSFAWLKNGVVLADQTNSSLSIGPVNGADAGVYSVVVSGACGVVTNSASLAVNTIVSASPLVSLTNCPGTIASFSTVAGGTGPLSFVWLKDGVVLADQTNSSLSVGPVNGADAGAYSVVVSGACGVVTNSASLAVNMVVSASALVSLTNCPGTIASFSTVAGGTGPLGFVWLKDGVVLADQTNSSLSVGPVNGADAGTYSVVVSGACGVVTNSASLAVNTIVSASALVSLTNCPGTMASFSTVAGGTGPLGFVWLKDGVVLADQTNSSLSVGPVNGADAGVYSMVVSGACGVVTNSASLAVNTIVSASPLVSLTNCPGTMASFSTVAGGTGPLSFAWLKDGVVLADQTNSSLSVGPVNGADAGTYSVVVSGACGVVTNSASLAVNTIVSASPLVSLTNCPGTIASFSTVTGGTGPLSFVWLKDGVVLADQTNSSLSVGPVNGADAGVYSVVVSGACGVVTNSASLAVNMVVSASPLVSLTNCPGTIASFSTVAGGTGPLGFVWLKDGVVLADQTNSSLSVGPVNGADAGTYSVVVSGACGVVTNSASLAVNTIVSASPLVSLTNCPGTMASFSTVAGGTGPLSFVWLKDGVVQADQTNSSLSIGPVNGADAGVYSVVVSGACGVVTNSASLAVNTVVSASPLVSLTNCPGTIASFSTVAGGTGPLSFAWLKNGVVLADQTNSSLSVGPVNGADAGTYSVVVSGTCGSVTNSASLGLYTTVAAVGPVSQTNCPGSTVVFSTTASGTGPYSYQWSKGGGVLVGQTGSSLTLTNIGAGDVAAYSVVVSGTCGSVTNSASLGLYTTVAAVGPVSQTNCPGSTVVFSTTASGTGPYSYQWSKGGGVLAGQTGSSLTLTNIGAGDVAAYSVVVSGTCGSVTNSASLGLYTTVAAVGPVSQTNCPGSTVVFSTTASGTGPYGYQWSKGGSVLAGQTGSSLTLTNIGAGDVAAYSVVVSGTCGSVTNSASLSLYTTVAAAGPVSQTNCPGSTVVFSTTASGTGPYGYQWSKGGGVLAGQTGSSLTLTNIGAGDVAAYSVVVSGTCGSVTNSASLGLYTTVAAVGPVSQTNCPGSTVVFSTTASGTGPYGYQWSKGGSVLVGQTGSSLTVTNIGAGDAAAYSVVVSGTCGSVTNSASLGLYTTVAAAGPVSQTNCPGSTVVFSTTASGTGPYSYQWSKGGSVLAGQTGSSLTLTNIGAGDVAGYSVVVSGTCGSVTNTASLGLYTTVAAVGPVSQTNCPGSTVVFSTTASGTGPYSYQWSKGGLVLVGQTGSSLTLTNIGAGDAAGYSVVVSGTCGSVTNSASLGLYTTVAAVGPVSQTNCPGSTAVFSTTASGTGPYSYQWSKGGGVLAGQTGSSLTLTNVGAGDVAGYSVVVSGTCGSVTNSASLGLYTTVAAAGPVSQTNCPGSTVVFSTTASGTGPYSYQWSKGGSLLAGKTNSSLTLTNIGASDVAGYSVVVSGTCGSVTNSASLGLYTTVAAVGPVSQTNCPGSTVVFSTTASGTGPYGYQWSKGGSVLVGQTGSSLTLTNIGAGDVAGYSVVVSGTCGSATNNANLGLYTTVAAVGPVSQTNCPGSTVVFSTTASGTGPYSYQWSKGGSVLAGQTGSSLTLTNIGAGNVAAYSVVVSGTCGSVTNNANLGLYTTVAAVGPVSQTNCPGSTVVFSTTASGTGPYSYQWSKGGSVLAGQTGSSLTLTNIGAGDVAAYSVVVSGTCGSVTNSASLGLYTTVAAVGPVSQTNCPGSTVVFSTTASGTGPYSYQWSKAGTVLASQTASSLTLTNIGAGDVAGYSVVVSGTCGSVTNSANLGLYTTVAAVGPVSQTNCPGSTVVFSTTASGTGPYSYQWSKAGTVLASQTASSLTLTNIGAGNVAAYSVVVSGTCGSVTNSASLGLYTTVAAVGPVSQTNCPGSTVVFSTTASGTGPYSYQWSKAGTVLASQTNSSLTLTNIGAADVAAYSVVVGGTCGSVTNSASLGLYTTVAAVGPVSQTNCPGSTVVFSTTASGTGPYNYQWSKKGVVLAGQTGSSLTLTNIASSDVAAYSVRVSGTCGSVTNNASLTLYTSVSAVGPASQTNCPGSTVVFSTTASGTGPFSYQWSKGGSVLAGQTSSALTLTNIGTADVASYSVVVNGACGSATNRANLGLYSSVSAVGPVSQTNSPASTAVFSTTASGTGPYGYQWFKGTNRLTGQTGSSLVLANVSAADAATYSVVVNGACGNPVTNSATLAVVFKFQITSIRATNGVATITWNSVASQTYRLQYKDTVGSTNWHDASPDVNAVGWSTSTTNALGTSTQRFYRVMALQPLVAALESVVTNNGIATITWDSVAGQVYRLQYKNTPSDTNWLDVVPDLTATGSTTTTTNAFGGSTQRIYRVILAQSSPPPFLITSIRVTNGVATVTWNSVAGKSYSLQYKNRLSDTNWQTASVVVTAAGLTTSATNVLGGAPQRFYRVVQVQPRPVITSVRVNGGVATLAWSAIAGQTYRLQYADSPNTTNWQAVVPDLIATNATVTATNAIGATPRRFYRVMVVP